jgi:hypothetical protein
MCITNKIDFHFGVSLDVGFKVRITGEGGEDAPFFTPTIWAREDTRVGVIGER